MEMSTQRRAINTQSFKINKWFAEQVGNQLSNSPRKILEGIRSSYILQSALNCGGV